MFIKIMNKNLLKKIKLMTKQSRLRKKNIINSEEKMHIYVLKVNSLKLYSEIIHKIPKKKIWLYWDKPGKILQNKRSKNIMIFQNKIVNKESKEPQQQ